MHVCATKPYHSAVIRPKVNKFQNGVMPKRLTVDKVIGAVSFDQNDQISTENQRNSFDRVLSESLELFECLVDTIDVAKIQCEACASLEAI